VDTKIAIPNYCLRSNLFRLYLEQAKWDLEDNEANRIKIWTVANDRYKGWRSTFSATYKAYTTYEDRMRHRPEELDIVEWHYLVSYFGTEEFQVCSQFFKKLANSTSDIKVYVLRTADFIKIKSLLVVCRGLAIRIPRIGTIERYTMLQDQRVFLN
jgi:hypothetical protein